MSDEEDFASMFEASTAARRFTHGQVVTGTIVSLGPKVALVDIGGKAEAQIELAELKDPEGDVEFSVGDVVQAKVVATAGSVLLSRKGVRNVASQRELEDAFHHGLAVEGRVERAVKGGYEVRILRERAFCPLSQIDTRRTVDPAVHEGQTYAFRVVEYKDGGRNLVVSRRALLEVEERADADRVRASLVPGAVVSGRVASVLDFGAFVDLGGGIQGLLHVSEMGWSRVSANEVTAPGESITVKVLKVDDATGKIALGLKQLQGDPWTQVTERYAVGQVYNGKVTRVADFGAFVELGPGIEALAHASTFPPTGRAGGWAKTIAPGTTAAFEILTIDPAQKRIGVAMVEEGSTRAAGATSAQTGIVPGAIVTGKVEKHEKFGVFVFLAPGKNGLIPFSETGVDRDEDLRKVFPIGGEVEVVVLEVDAAGRRIRLSKKGVAEHRERAELREYSQRTDAAPSASLGSMADKLRGALGRR